MSPRRPPSPVDAALHYAAKPAVHHRLPARWCVAGAALLAVVISTWFWGEPAWRKVRLLYWQSQCLSYTAPPERQIDPARPDAVPDAWRRFYALHSPPGLESAGTVYLHERTSPDGDRRLVVVEVYAPPESARLVAPRVFAPGGVFSRPREVLSVAPGISCAPGSRLFSGQSDPDDASHFTFAIESAEGRLIVDGWLEDDDTVKLEPRRDEGLAGWQDAPIDGAARAAAGAAFTASPSSSSRPRRVPGGPAGRRTPGR